MGGSVFPSPHLAATAFTLGQGLLSDPPYPYAKSVQNNEGARSVRVFWIPARHWGQFAHDGLEHILLDYGGAVPGAHDVGDGKRARPVVNTERAEGMARGQ